MILESLSSMFGGGQKEEKEPSKDGKLADLKSRRNALSRWMASPDKHPDDANQLEKLDKEIERLEEIKKLEEKAN